MKWLLCGLISSLAVLCLAVPSHAAPVTFTYTQTDASTGSGTISGNIDVSPWGGPSSLTFSADLPPAQVIQNDANTSFPVPQNAVGFITRGTDANPGSGPQDGVGVYLDLSGPPITLTGTDGPDTWTIDVPRVMRSGVPYNFNFSVFDDPAGAGDVTGRYEFAGWPGDNGAGHRHTAQRRTFETGQDSTSASASGGSLGSNANGDNLGFMAGLRATNDAPPPYPIFVDEITFGGRLHADQATLLKNDARPPSPAPDEVFFGYRQTDAATGAGALAAYNVDGILFTGAMPDAEVIQNDTTNEPLPPGIVGFITRGTTGNPGGGIGVHLGWSGTTTLMGEIRDDLDPSTATSNPNVVNMYELDVALKAVVGRPHRYTFDTFDDNSGVGGTNDVTNTLTHRAWIGDNGAGHRQTGPDYGYSAGPDTFRAAASFDDLGSHASGDDLGITAGVGGTAPDATLFVDEMAFWGVVEPVGAPRFVGGAAAPELSGVITDLTVTGSGLAAEGASIETGAFGENALVFTDRTFPWESHAGHPTIDELGLTGVDYVRFANDDKEVSDFEAVIEMEPGLKNLFLLIDDRVHRNKLADIFNDNMFVDTGTRLLVGGDNRPSSLFVLPKFYGTSIALGPQDDGSSRNMYGFVAQRAIPEPSAALLLLGAAHVLLFWRRRVRGK